MSSLANVDAESRVFLLNLVELSAVVFRGPDAAGWAAVAREAVPELTRAIPRHLLNCKPTLENLQQSILRLSERSEPFLELEAEYVRLFVSTSGGVAAPPYESCHGQGGARVMGDAALAMRARLETAGLAVALDGNEPPDHLSIELEYLYHLLATGWAQERSDLEMQGREFAGQVMLPWVIRFRERLAQASPHPAFLHAADACVTALDELG